MQTSTRQRIAVLAEGEEAVQWLAAAKQFADVRSLPKELPGAIDAVVVGPGAFDPFARTKEALLAGLHVLYAAPFLLSPWQANVLANLSRRQGRLLRFIEPFRYLPGFPFLSRLLRGDEPFWEPLYLRLLRLGQPASSLDQLAIEELAVCEALLEGTPRQMTAAASRRDQAGEICAVVLILQYPDGPLVQSTVSLAEAREARQLVAVTPSRTLILDDRDPTAPLRILAEDGEREVAVEEVAANIPEFEGESHSARTIPDVATEETRQFLQATASGCLDSIANSERWVRVASLWWAARQSMSFDGPADVPIPRETGPPLLRVIEGGGKKVQTAARRPALTVVAR